MSSTVACFNILISLSIYGITSRLVKAVIDPIIDPLTKIYNDCLTNGVFPEEMQMARVCPVFKKGESNDPTNYRPIAALLVFEKIFESLIREQMPNFLIKQIYLSEAVLLHKTEEHRGSMQRTSTLHNGSL